MLRVLSGALGTSLFVAGALLGSPPGSRLFLIYAASGQAPADLVQLVLPDATFTGRTALWTFITHGLGDNWLAGAGFGSIWGVGFQSPNLFSPYDFVRIANQAHNGYLDVLAALGVIGLVLIAVLFLNFGAITERLRPQHLRVYRLSWFIVLFSLVHNMMESSLLVPFAHVWHLTIFAILLATRFADQDA